MPRNNRIKPFYLLAIFFISTPFTSFGESFVVESGQTVGPQTLSDPKDTGLIESGGAIDTNNADGVSMLADKQLLINDGSITTDGNDADGVFSSGSCALILNNGSIVTDGNDANGILSSGEKVKIVNDGTITTQDTESIGIFSTGGSASIVNSGSITTTRTESLGIQSTGACAKILNTGSIRTTGFNAQGIRSTGSCAEIINEGSITTTNELSTGIVSEGEKSLICNAGSISTGLEAPGISSSGDGSFIRNSGSITITENSDGIISTGKSTTICNSGSIHTQFESDGINSSGDRTKISSTGSISVGLDSNGIFSSGEGDLICNLGMITLRDSSSNGVNAIGASTKILNTGFIEVSDEDSNGIRSFGSQGTICNSGTIMSRGVNSVPIFSIGTDTVIINTGELILDAEATEALISSGENVSICNSGSVVASGFDVTGIFSTGAIAKISSNGIVFCEGDEVVGIASTGQEATICNSGLISISGMNGIGISSSGQNAKITNSGLILTTSDELSGGIISSGDNATVCNSGSIITGGGDAIRFQGENATLTLLKGSQIEGTVNLLGGGTRTLNVGKGLNLLLETENGFWDQINTHSSPFVVQNNQVATIDRTGFSMGKDILADLTESIFTTIYGRMKWGAGISSQGRCSNHSVWLKGFGSYRKRKSHGRLSSYKNSQGGMLAGVEFPWICEGRLGILAGGASGSSKVDHGIHEIEYDSGFLGLYTEREWCGHFIGGAIAVGFLDQDSVRKIKNNTAECGEERAKESENCPYVSVEVQGSTPLCLWGYLPEVTGLIRYAGLFRDTYKEKGSEADLKLSAPNIQLLTLRGELTMPCYWMECQGFETEGYGGVQGRFCLGDEDYHGKLLDQSIRFSDGSKDSLGELFFGLRGNYRFNCGFQLLFHIEAAFDTERSRHVFGDLTLAVPF